MGASLSSTARARECTCRYPHAASRIALVGRLIPFEACLSCPGFFLLADYSSCTPQGDFCFHSLSFVVVQALAPHALMEMVDFSFMSSQGGMQPTGVLGRMWVSTPGTISPLHFDQQVRSPETNHFPISILCLPNFTTLPSSDPQLKPSSSPYVMSDSITFHPSSYSACLTFPYLEARYLICELHTHHHPPYGDRILIRVKLPYLCQIRTHRRPQHV